MAEKLGAGAPLDDLSPEERQAHLERVQPRSRASRRRSPVSEIGW
jgi:hypothetical protein